jgi:hypothetical protein
MSGMNRSNICIFCRTETGPFTTREHVLPESLGGGEWAVLPDGIFCDTCQNRFGSEIEQQALGDYPFSVFRTFLGIPTKKGKAPWFKSWEGVIRAAPGAGIVGYDPAPVFEDAVYSSNKTRIRILAHPLKPDMICRFLLKIGLEIVAATDVMKALDPRYDAARRFALTGVKDWDWWYFQQEDMQAASRFITNGVSDADWRDGVRFKTIYLDHEPVSFNLRLLYLNMLVPLIYSEEPTMDGLKEPEFRLFVV